MRTRLFLLPVFLLAFHANNYSCGPKFWEEATHLQPRPLARDQNNGQIDTKNYHEEFPHERAQHENQQKKMIVAAAIVAKAGSHS